MTSPLPHVMNLCGTPSGPRSTYWTIRPASTTSISMLGRILRDTTSPRAYRRTSPRAASQASSPRGALPSVLCAASRSTRSRLVDVEPCVATTSPMVRLSYRNRHPKLGTPRPRLDVDLAIVVADDASRNVEAKARALTDRLGGEERVEDTRLHLRRNAGAVVHDANDDLISLSPGADGDFAGLTNGAERVLEEVQPDWIQLAVVRAHLRKTGR